MPMPADADGGLVNDYAVGVVYAAPTVELASEPEPEPEVVEQ